MNSFLNAAGKHNALTENGALAHSTTGSILADQFSKSGSHRGRDIKTVFAEQSQLNGDNPDMALRFVFYLRMITRKINGAVNTDTVQRGQGNRDESFKRYLWYATSNPDVFYKNLWLFAVVGSSKDIWDILRLAEENQISVDRKLVYTLYARLISVEETSNLALKFLPLPVASSKAVTVRAKLKNKFAIEFAKFMGLNGEQLRSLKANGRSAYSWQVAISQRRFKDLEFNKISGRALSSLVSGKFLANHNLESVYEKWISSQPVAKFTGYPYELGMKTGWNMKPYQKNTVDKQFEGLIQLAKQDGGALGGNVWCAVDTSGSMDQVVANTTALNICISLGIYFSALNEGAFHKNIIMFDSTSKVTQLTGTFTDMWEQIKSSTTAWGSTNFQSVVDEIVRIRTRNPKIPLSDYPQTLLVVSDMQFNPTDSYSFGYADEGTKAKATNTNHEELVRKLSSVFPAEWVKAFKVVWWDCTGRVADNQPTHMDEGGTYVFSGFDGSVISLLLGKEKTSVNEKDAPSLVEIIHQTLSQEVLNLVKI